ncbi:MAG: GtrA family protein [Candidatus Eremiobacteraeota bacterium]|nr:GtrA family protein [Candidatus Eremiobacteraeota bacterium]
MIDFARRFYAEKSWPFQLARYLSIGGIVTCLDFGSFALLLRAGWPLLGVITGSWVVAIVSHFALNKYVNFRAHDRPAHHQATTYGVVALVVWLTTTGIVKGAVALGAPALLGKCVAIAFNIPIGFLGHRYLTFGRGIVATLRGALERRDHA